MIDVDIEWMSPPARTEFLAAVGVFAQTVRSGEVGGYKDGENGMRRAGQIHLQDRQFGSSMNAEPDPSI